MLDRLTWLWKDRYCLVLTGGLVHVLRVPIWTRQDAAQLLETDSLASQADADTVHAVLDALLRKASAQGRGLQLVLGDDWVQFAQIQPPTEAQQVPDLEAAAAMQLQKMLDSTPADTASACDPSFQSPFLGCAVQRSLLKVVTNVAAAQRMPLCSVVPEFALVWNHWHRALRPGEWLGVCNSRGLVLGLAEHSRLQAVRHKRLAWDGCSPAVLTDVLAQEALRSRISPPTALALCGHVPAAWPLAGDGMRVLGGAASALAVLGVVT